jgi:hypothetical protein
MHTPFNVVLFTCPVFASKSHPCSGVHAGVHGETWSSEPGVALRELELVKQPFVSAKLIVCAVLLRRKRWFLYVTFDGSLVLHPHSFK